MSTVSRFLILMVFLGLAACSSTPEVTTGLWANTSSEDYAPYCTIEYCDEIETSTKPECTCPCTDDSDGCEGPNCAEGCTFTQGYWKNHNELKTSANQKRDWPLPFDESQLMCGQKLLDILNTSPRGEAWYILAHQYIAASLNAASGASTSELGTALADARAMLTANCGGITTNRQAAIDLSYKLDSYNNGLIGPGHCD